MFSIDHLHTLRDQELKQIVKQFEPSASVLEIGAGTGAQALALSRLGFKMTAIDLPQSNYTEHRVYPVVDYDGSHLPCADACFDVVFSSNVLEHVLHLEPLQQEIHRVLKPTGCAVHVLPTTSWRFWTTISEIIHNGGRIISMLPALLPRLPRRGEGNRLRAAWLQVYAAVARSFAFEPHGETGNALTELWSFSRRRWIRQFRRDGFLVDLAVPMRLFYTGYMIFGSRWSIAGRQRASRLLGSACYLYRLSPNAEAQSRKNPRDVGETIGFTETTEREHRPETGPEQSVAAGISAKTRA